MEWGEYLSRYVVSTDGSLISYKDHLLASLHTNLNRIRCKSVDSQSHKQQGLLMHMSTTLWGDSSRRPTLSSVRPQDHIKAKYNNLTGIIHLIRSYAYI